MRSRDQLRRTSGRARAHPLLGMCGPNTYLGAGAIGRPTSAHARCPSSSVSGRSGKRLARTTSCEAQGRAIAPTPDAIAHPELSPLHRGGKSLRCSHGGGMGRRLLSKSVRRCPTAPSPPAPRACREPPVAAAGCPQAVGGAPNTARPDGDLKRTSVRECVTSQAAGRAQIAPSWPRGHAASTARVLLRWPLLLRYTGGQNRACWSLFCRSVTSMRFHWKMSQQKWPTAESG